MKKLRWTHIAGILLVLASLLCVLPQTAKADNSPYIFNVYVQVEEPRAGYTPLFEAIITEDDPKYYIASTVEKTNYINGVAWYDVTAEKYLKETDIFVKDHDYCVRVLVYSKTNYSFFAEVDNSYCYYYTDGYVNGNKASIGPVLMISYPTTRGEICYTFEDCKNPPTKLNQIAITGVDTPSDGALPDQDVTVTTENCKIAVEKSNKVQAYNFSKGIGWRQSLDGGYTYTLSGDDQFASGNVYRVEVLVEAVHPYRFAVDSSGKYQVDATVKGYKATVRDAYGYLDPSRYCVVTYEFPAICVNHHVFDKVLISDLDAPVPGKTPDYTASTTTGAQKRGTDTAYMKNGIVWYDASVGTNMKTTDVFQEGHVYTAKISLQAAEGYLFKDDASGAMLTTATVNGQPASVINELLGPDKLQVNYTFPVCQKIEISKVNITIKEPKLAEKGSYDVTFDVAGITTKDRTDALFSKGVGWWDNAENVYLDVGQRFVGGRSYNLEVYLVLEDGYTAAKNMTVTVNGNPAEVWGGTNIIVYYTTAELPKATGWYQAGKEWVFIDGEGNYRTGWMQASSQWYYFDESGTMAVGWKKIGEKQYYFNAGGTMYSGWLKEAGVWYYLKPGSGDLAIGWLTIGGKTYYFKNNGRMVTGSVEIDGKRYEFDANGALIENAKKGWIQESGKWYYYENGAKVLGWKTIGGSRYYFKADGVMVTGWQKLDGYWYYFQSSGAMKTGWLEQGSVKYYLMPDGKMATGTVTIDGKQHNFDYSGAWKGEGAAAKNGWVQEDGKWYYYQNGTKKTGWLLYGKDWYYLKPDGSMQTGWLLYGSVWYYFDANGVMVTGSKTIGGKTYNFDSSGVCLNP